MLIGTLYNLNYFILFIQFYNIIIISYIVWKQLKYEKGV